jgi:predicted AAA+ superfamily ATPase
MLVARGLRHARVHVGVLVRLAGDGGLEVLARAADRQVGRGIADLREVVEVAVRVPGLAFRGRAEQRGDVVLPFDVGLVREVEVTAVRLRLAGERGLEVVVRPGSLQRLHRNLLVMTNPARRARRPAVDATRGGARSNASRQ